MSFNFVDIMISIKEKTNQREAGQQSMDEEDIDDD